MSSDSRAWGGRFSQDTDAAVEAMNASIGFDKALWLEDIAGSVAQSRMLAAQALISADEQKAIEDGLAGIAADIRAGAFEWSVAREDVHMNIEGALTDRIGAVAGKLHTGRSRNDQVALDLRLWLRRNLTELASKTAAVVDAFLNLAARHVDVAMPGYTHLQRGQPVTFGHHMMAYAAMFLRDTGRLLDCRERAAEMPLGSGALAGSPLPLDRHHVAASLAMPTLTLNSLDAVSDRDPALETLGSLSILMVHLSRLAEELVLWSSQEFAFVELSDAFCTGSSLMPQKKNPDIPELLRAKVGRTLGSFTTLAVVMKGLPLSYNKDMQEDKEPLFDAVRTAHEALGILPAMLRNMTVKADRLGDALRDGYVLATDLADHLVEQGVPFRDAHHVIGKAVGLAIAGQRRLEDFSLAELRELHPAFGDDALAVLDPQRSLARRDLPGAPAPDRIHQAIGEAITRLAAHRIRMATGGPCAIERALASGEILP